jgi:hypothetical protein
MQIKWGAGILDARGSLGAMTVSRNRYGAYARARISPVNPQSQRQSDIRALIAFVTTQWTFQLTQPQRDAWGVFASNVPTTNKLGEVINLSGFNQYLKSNVVALNGGLAQIDDAPLIFALPGEDPNFEATVDAGTDKITIVFDDTRDWLDEDEAGMIVQMGIPVNPGIQFFNGPWRHAGVIEGDSIAAPTTPDATIDVPFEIGDGEKIFVRAKIVRADGRVSDWFRDNTIAATA